MIKSGSTGRIPDPLVSVVVFLLVIAALVGAYLVGGQKAGRLRTVLEETTKKSQLASSMEVNLLAAAAAEKSAVMADTDQGSKEFADAAQHATAAVEADRGALAGLVEAAGNPEQVERLSAFNECWTRYQEIDREVLGLAVENTNLKALRLSFFPAREALERMQSALNNVVDTAADAEIARLAYRAMTAALKIHTLHGQHIAEARDEEMDRIEVEMKALDSQVDSALAALATQAGDAAKASVDEARNAYADFQKVNAEVLGLSRRNSNVRSLALSLGQKHKVTAECQVRLSALQDSFKRQLTNATR